MKRVFGIIGGDLRLIKLAQLLSKEDNLIYTYGLEKYVFKENNIIKSKSIEELAYKCKYIIASIPFSKDGITLYSMFTDNEICIEDLLDIIKDRVIIAGAINKDIRQRFQKNNIQVIDLLDIEELTISNVIPTVEGAIKVAIEETDFTINNSKILILGFGRIGKLLAKTLNGLGARVYCEARKQSDIVWIKAYGYNSINLSNLNVELKNKYDIIFNTVPDLILDKKRLEIVKEYNPLIIELASKPFGIDFEEANRLGIKTIKAQGLPGKVAPYTSAINIKNVIENIIKD